MSGFNLEDYVTVAERLEQFVGKFPEGSIQTDIVELSDKRVVMRATVYRTPADERPSVAHSALGIPGATPYTRGSEIENAETSAIGRAIAFLGFDVKRSVASRDEVAAKAGEEKREIASAPITTTDDGGLIGTVEKGKSPVDMDLRQTPDGPAWGFKLKSGSKGYQALATGGLAEALSVSGLTAGTRVIVYGRIDMVPWDKDGKAMPPYARIAIERVTTPDFTLPAETTEAESLPLPLDDDERVLVGGGLPA